MSASAVSVPWFLRVLWAFVRRELAAMGGYRMAFVIRLLGFGLAVGSLLFLSRFVGASVNPHLAAYRGNYLGFVVLGFLAAEFQQVGVSVLAQRIRMAQVMGTLEAELATPAPPWMVLGAPPVYEFATAALRSAAYLLGAKLLLGLDLSHVNWVSLVVAVPLVIAAFSGLGLLAAATTMLVRRLNPVAMVIGSLSFFLSGVMYPVTVLPGWLRAVAASCRSPTRSRSCVGRSWLAPASVSSGRHCWRCSSSRGFWPPSAPSCSPSPSGGRASTARSPIIDDRRGDRPVNKGARNAAASCYNETSP